LTSNQTIGKIHPVPMKLLYFLLRSIMEGLGGLVEKTEAIS